MNILNIAAYRFVAVNDPAQLRAEFKARAAELGLKGTILIAPEGGILNYFEQCGGAHFRGARFVFDERVALDPALRASGSGRGA